MPLQDAAAATKKAKIEELKAKGDYKGAKKIADEVEKVPARLQHRRGTEASSHGTRLRSA